MIVVDTIPISATIMKGMILDAVGHRLLVSLRDKSQIAVVDTITKHVTLWSPSGVHENVPLALDRADHLVFVGSRHPGRLQVLDSRDGRVLTSLPCTETSDSMSYDGKARLLYVSGDGGMSRYRVDLDRADQHRRRFSTVSDYLRGTRSA